MTDLNAFLPYVNHPALGWIFRRGLWIGDRKHKIVRITPSAYHVHLGGDNYRGVFRTSSHYMEAAYKNLDWFMRTAHAWDRVVLHPALDMGFGSYTYDEQPDETSGKDTFLSLASPSTNYETEVYITAGQVSGGVTRRSLIAFDLSSIPISAGSTAATLSLWTQNDQSNNTRTFYIWRVLRNWVESEATWYIYSTGNSWGTDGCGNSTTDYDGTTGAWASASIDAAESIGTEIQWDFTSTGLSELDKFFNGTNTNYGWRLTNTTEVQDGWSFDSSSSATSSERPQLVITYTGGGVLWYY